MLKLDTSMQTKAFKVFWHKADVQMVEQQDHQAPVFAISRPSLLGGRKEFLLQYPAQLEPPTQRNLKQYRFTVRHGKKRRSFQAPDAVTFHTWLSALEQALKSQSNTEPSSSSRNSDAQCRVCKASSGSSQALWKRPCYTRDPNNYKLIRLRHPIAGINSTDRPDATLDVFGFDLDVEVESEKMTEEVDVSNDGQDRESSSVTATSSIGLLTQDTVTDSDLPWTNTASKGECKDDVDRVLDMNERNFIDLGANPEAIDSEKDVAVDAPKTIEVCDDITDDVVDIHGAPASFVNDSSKKFELGCSSQSPFNLKSEHLWVPIDPENSKLIWVRRQFESEVLGIDHISPRRRSGKQCAPVDPRSFRPKSIRQSENGTSRSESRYKATSNARKWVPVTPLDDGSYCIRSRRHLVPNGSVATPIVNSSMSQLFHCGKQRRH